jgi:hypothetical protein
MRVSYRIPLTRPAVCHPDSLIAIDAFGVAGFNVPDRTPAVIRRRIEQFKDQLLAMPERIEFPVEHTLIDGVYTRTLFIPKGKVLVGKIHLKECVNIVAKGDISVLTETGCGRFQAGHVAISGPGIQKVGLAHEDTVFINVFRTDETDITKIEAEIASECFPAIEHTGSES